MFCRTLFSMQSLSVVDEILTSIGSIAKNEEKKLKHKGQVLNLEPGVEFN